MNKTYIIDEARPKRLFLMWYLLYLQEYAGNSEYFSKDYFEFDYWAIEKFFYCDKVDEYLFDFLQYEIVEEILFNQYKEVEKEDGKKEINKKEIEDTTYQIIRFEPKKIKKGYVWVKQYSDFRYSNRIAHIGIKINKNKAKQYINDYIELWKNNDLFLPDENILKKENQIEIVVKKIFEIEKKHSYKNMLVNIEHEKQNEIDFVATILLLESINDIEVNDFIQKRDYLKTSDNDYISLQNLFFRITLKDKFFQDFTESKNKIHFDFEEICKQNKKRKIIYYDQPYKLTKFYTK